MEIDEPNFEPSGFQYISEDIVGMVSMFLNFSDMANASKCARAWYYFGRREIFKRNVERRWSYHPEDFGMGKSTGLSDGLMSFNYWKKRILVREEIQMAVQMATRDAPTARMRIKQLSDFITDRANTPLKVMIYTVEGCRWIIEWFDGVQSRDISNPFLTPEIHADFLRYISAMMQENRSELWVQHLGAKAIGILAISEHNRKKMVRCGNVSSLANALRFMMNNQNWKKSKTRLIVPNIMWSLVVTCRPIGGQEGEPYMREEDEHFENIKVLSNLGTIDLVLYLLKSDAEPSVLAKAFWLTVNLALVDEVKQKIIANEGIQSILKAMRLYPEHEEMQYRANFALINLCIRSPAKAIMLQQNGIPLVIDAMRRFPKSFLMQKCGTNVIRSLLNQDNGGCRMVLAGAGAAEVLTHIINHFENQHLRFAAIAALNAIN